MEIPVYITPEEVRRVCLELKISDWSNNTPDRVDQQEAQNILDALNIEDLQIPISIFVMGLEVELEHGTRFPEANVTNNHPLLTGKIVYAHLKETMDYYLRLDVAELEGDLLKAIQAGTIDKAANKYRKLQAARMELANEELKAL